MNAIKPQAQQPQMPPQALLAQMTFGFLISQAISVAARLYIADQLQDGPKTIRQLAESTETNEAALYRLLRALMSAGLFQRDADGKYSNNVMSEMLRSDHPESMRGIAHLMCDREHWLAHGNMMQSIKTGENGFEFTHGQPFFSYATEHPKAGHIFDEAMTSFSRGIVNAVTTVYDFSGTQKIADIGGGHGILLAKILEKNPQAEGVLFDQPQVVTGAKNLLEKSDVAERTEIVGGDFFKEISVEANIYLMKHILHDWTDEQSDAILENLSKTAQTGAKLLLIESVVEENDSLPSMSKVMDLNMLVATGGKERTEKEYAELLARHGFKLTKIYPTPSPVQIVEAIKA